MKYLFFLIILDFFLPASGQVKKVDVFNHKFQKLPETYDQKLYSRLFGQKILKNNRIIALGEFSHGAYEPIAFKANLTRYLIEVRGYRNIVFEQADFSFVKEVRNYLIENTTTDSQKLEEFIRKNNFPRAVSLVYVDLFKWIKRFNVNNPHDTITIHGFEIDINEKIFEYVLNKFIIPIDYKKSQQYIFNLNSSMEYADKLNIINNWYDNEKQTVEELYNKEDVNQLKFLIKNAFMSVNYIKKSVDNSFQNLEEKSQMRDSIMAENIIELCVDKKSIVWAHNGHVIRTKSIHMGSRLNNVFGNEFFVVATDFSKTATIDFVINDSSTNEKTNYSTRIISSGNSTVGNELYEKYNIQEGVFTLKELSKKKVGQATNAIGARGSHFIIHGDTKPFDLLILFENTYPYPENAN